MQALSQLSYGPVPMKTGLVARSRASFNKAYLKNNY